MVEIRLLWAWARARVALLREQDGERGNLLVWAVMTALLVAAAIAVVAIIVAKAKSTANNTKTQ